MLTHKKSSGIMDSQNMNKRSSSGNNISSGNNVSSFF